MVAYGNPVTLAIVQTIKHYITGKYTLQEGTTCHARIVENKMPSNVDEDTQYR